MMPHQGKNRQQIHQQGANYFEETKAPENIKTRFRGHKQGK